MSEIRTKPLSTHRSRGQSLVEFAVVIPIFLLLIFGLIDVGRLVYINNALSQGAREAARWGSVQYNSETAAGLLSIADHAKGSMAAVPDPVATATCETDPGIHTLGEVVTTCDILVVKVSSHVTMLTPILAQIVGPQDFTATSRVTVNQ